MLIIYINIIPKVTMKSSNIFKFHFSPLSGDNKNSMYASMGMWAVTAKN